MINDSMKDHAKQAADDMMHDPKETMKESGQDWVEYIRTHPMQSIAFGLAIMFAIKGMMK